MDGTGGTGGGVGGGGGGGRGGLRLLDYATMRWVDFEAEGCPADVAVVFGGETLAHLTRSQVMPAVHDVMVKEPGLRRTSVVYQHLGARDARIPAHNDAAVGSGGGTATAATTTAGDLVRAISASRRSSNFPAELVAKRRESGM